MDSYDENEGSSDGSESLEESKGTTNGKRQINETGKKHKRVKYENISGEEVSPKKKRKNDLYKPPTVEELNNLKETENLFNNNLFRLQITELISEITIKNKRKKQYVSWLESFKQSLENISEYEDIILSSIQPILKKKLNSKEKFIHNLASNYTTELKTDQDLMLKFVKPDHIETFGLYEINSLCGPNLQANINIKIPKRCFNVKDFLNNRYLTKRYYYLLYIAEHLRSCKSTSKISMKYHENNILLPILQVEPADTDKIIANIYVTPSEDYFKATRFLPDMNNFKQDLFQSQFTDPNILKETPTIFYNTTLAHDVTLSVNNNYIKSVLNDQESIQEGIKLLCIWLKQRELNINFVSFTEDLITYFITYLFVKKKINKFMSSYQVIRNFWSFVSTTDLSTSTIAIGEVSKEIMDNFKKSFDLVFLDKTGCYNVAGFLNKEVYKKVQTECELALQHLDDSKTNSFHLLFLTKLPFHLQFDLIIDLKDILALKDTNISDTEKAKYVGYKFLPIVNSITEILQKGLNKRILNLVPRLQINSKNELESLIFGVNLNQDEAFNFIELGPALNDHTEADEFRKFWGHLSSDRRFRDGSTHVAVYFKTNTIRGKREIVKKIIKFLMTEKLDIKYNLHYDEFEEVLLNKKIIPPYPIGTNEESSLKIVTLSDDLGKKIRNLPMSLSITGLQGVSDIYSYTEVFPPIATNYKVGETLTAAKGCNITFSDKKIGMVPRYVQPIECVLQLEHSSKWPNNLIGVRHIKTSFYLEIAKLLKENYEILCHVTKEYLDVFYEGLVFRYKLYLPKEIALLKIQATEDGMTSYKESLESLSMEKRLNVLPKVNGSLKGLQSQHPSYGPGTSLIKRWLRSQLIDDFHFPDVVVNLLNASLYLNRTSFTPSSTPQISFLRFLKFISEFQWDLQPVILNFNEEISNDDISEMETKFQQNREAFPCLYIVIPYDQGNSLFTKSAPTKEVLFRVQQLAIVTLNFFYRIITNENVDGIKEVFVPNWEGYNVLIHLRPLLNPRRHEQVTNSIANRMVLKKYNPEESKKIPIVNFNPVEIYLKTLRENYGEFAMFFHDTFGGNTIGVLWNPKALQAVDFKVSHVSGKKLVDDKLILNVDAIIEDFYIIGKDLVKLIEKK